MWAVEGGGEGGLVIAGSSWVAGVVAGLSR